MTLPFSYAQYPSIFLSEPSQVALCKSEMSRGVAEPTTANRPLPANIMVILYSNAFTTK